MRQRLRPSDHSAADLHSKNARPPVDAHHNNLSSLANTLCNILSPMSPLSLPNTQPIPAPNLPSHGNRFHQFHNFKPFATFSHKKSTRHYWMAGDEPSNRPCRSKNNKLTLEYFDVLYVCFQLTRALTFNSDTGGLRSKQVLPGLARNSKTIRVSKRLWVANHEQMPSFEFSGTARLIILYF